MKIIAILVTCILLSISCNNKIQDINKSTSSTEQVDGHFITTVILKFSAIEDTKFNVSIYKSITAKGQLRHSILNDEKLIKNDIIIEGIDQDSKIIISQNIDNPLCKTYEYADESGQFHKKIINLTEEYISFIYSSSKNIHHLNIYTLNNKVKALTQTLTL